MFHETYRVNRTQDYGLKICKQVQNYLMMSEFQKLIKFCKHFYGAENNKLKIYDI